MAEGSIITAVERYYSGKFAEHGPTARGVDWNSEASQELPFRPASQGRGPRNAVHRSTTRLRLRRAGPTTCAERVRRRYRGFDISEPMLEHARRARGRAAGSSPIAEDELEPADYTVASGIFNVRLGRRPTTTGRSSCSSDAGRSSTALAASGFAFNMLTRYSDADRMRPDLYYGDPRCFFDLCKRATSRNVALLHDYGLYEFTIVVRQVDVRDVVLFGTGRLRPGRARLSRRGQPARGRRVHRRTSATSRRKTLDGLPVVPVRADGDAPAGPSTRCSSRSASSA